MNQRIKSGSIKLFVLSLAVVVVGCSSPKPKPAERDGVVQVGANTQPNDRRSTVQLRREYSNIVPVNSPDRLSGVQPEDSRVDPVSKDFPVPDGDSGIERN